MNLKLLKIGFCSISFLSFFSFLAILFLINPFNASTGNLLLFSGTLFLFLFSLFSWLGFYVRKRFITENSLNRILKMAFRQGFLISVLPIAYLWLNHFKTLKVWSALPMLFLIVGLEYYFLVVYPYKKSVDFIE